MKRTTTYLLLACLFLGISSLSFGGSKPKPIDTKAPRANQVIPRSIKGAVAVPGPFRVKQVIFSKGVLNNKTYLGAVVIFNRNIDPASVQQGVNIRMLKKNENNFWFDASSQNTVRINPTSIAWLSGSPLETGYYKMHLRGTLKSADGIYLDCNGDGKGEGGYLPAYESQLYHAVVINIQEKESPIPDELKSLLPKE